MKTTLSTTHNPTTQPSKPPSRGGWTIKLATLALLALATLFIADYLYNPKLFRIQVIELHGQFSRVDREQTRQVVAQSLSGNYFSISLPALEKRLAQLPWVFRTTVRRKWPDTLAVEVIEIKPVAKWGKHQWLNFTGDLVARQPGIVTQNLPLLSAPDKQKEVVWQAFKNWSKMFATNGINLQQLRVEPRGLWYLTLSVMPNSEQKDASRTENDHITIIVKQKNAVQQIERLMNTLPHALLPEFAAMRSVDLRYPNGFAVSWKTTSPPPRRLAKAPRQALLQ